LTLSDYVYIRIDSTTTNSDIIIIPKYFTIGREEEIYASYDSIGMVYWDFHTNAIITIISIELKSLCNQNDCF